jgi:beta-lactamase class A
MRAERPRTWYANPVVWVGLAALAVVVGAVWLLGDRTPEGHDDCEQNLINPAACTGELEGKVGFEAFRRDLEEELLAAKAEGKLLEAGIYFRDLHAGPTFGLNANEEFLPMSLLKLPVMVAVLKAAEANPSLLEQRLRTPPSFAMNVQLMKEGETLTPDREYTVGELLEYMITYSDNKALGMLSDWLAENVGDESVRNVMVDLGIVRVDDEVDSLSITPKSYSTILRILYGAAYLSPDYSQRALELLTKTKFDEGITYGVPDGVLVAHKFGIREDPGVNVQLHDCGIVYHPGGPYLLCVMTRGKSYKDQAHYIQDVASSVYGEMSRRMAE